MTEFKVELVFKRSSNVMVWADFPEVNLGKRLFESEKKNVRMFSQGKKGGIREKGRKLSKGAPPRQVARRQHCTVATPVVVP